LLEATLLDDTPTANSDTRKWIAGFADDAPAAAQPAMSWAPLQMQEPALEELGAGQSEAPPDVFDLAVEAVRDGRTEDAVSLLATEIVRESCGRGKFQRKLQLAQICLSTGHDGIARSLLEELATAIDRHQLEEWEPPDVIAHALSLLYSCASHTQTDPAAQALLFARICRLSPVLALKQGKQAFAHRG
jgi:type VI secretion system protein ImpA